MSALLEAAGKRYSADELEMLQRAVAVVKADAPSADAPTPGEEAALLLLGMRLDAQTVCAAMLTDQTATEEFPAGVRQLLQGVERLNAIRWDRLDDEAAESLRRMFLAMAKDVRVVLIVLALRVGQMRHLEQLSEEERARLAREALEVFAPLANRLGIWQLKSDLEDGAFEVLEPESFRRLSDLLAQRREERASFVAEVVHDVVCALEKNGIQASVAGRPKHLYSIYKKMLRKQVDFDQIFDISAVRVIVDEVAQCYGALGVVHAMWPPIKGEFDDYIALPKGNGYQSLHTAVVGPRGKPVEVQFRTRQMHRFAEFGVAAHWAYKEQRGGTDAQDRFMVLRRLLDWERELEDPKQFVESLQTDIFEDQVLVFTPVGDVIDLPRGATPLDFAYRVHTMVGHRTKGARVNGQIVSLDVELQTGDRVEILTQKEPAPSRDWMNPKLGYLKTASARGKVRHWFREQGREQAVFAGRQMLDKELSRLELAEVTPSMIAEALDMESVEALHAAIGYGDKSIVGVASTALELERGEEGDEVVIEPAPISRRGATGVTLDGVSDVMGKRAHCCNPLPGDDVLGFVTRGRGIVIHRRDCANVRQSPEPERWVEIDWGANREQAHGVEVEVLAQTSSGLLNRVVRLLSTFGIVVSAANMLPSKDERIRLRLTVQARDSEQLTIGLQRVSSLHDVEEVRLVAR